MSFAQTDWLLTLVRWYVGGYVKLYFSKILNCKIAPKAVSYECMVIPNWLSWVNAEL